MATSTLVLPNPLTRASRPSARPFKAVKGMSMINLTRTADLEQLAFVRNLEGIR